MSSQSFQKESDEGEMVLRNVGKRQFTPRRAGSFGLIVTRRSRDRTQKVDQFGKTKFEHLKRGSKLMFPFSVTREPGAFRFQPPVV